MIGNLYNMARNLIPADQVSVKKFLGNITNDVGQKVPSFGDAVVIDGVFQPMEQQHADRLGLAIDKTYRTLYTTETIQTIEDGTSGDLVLFGSDTYQALKKTDWIAYNGWNGVICVRL